MRRRRLLLVPMLILALDGGAQGKAPAPLAEVPFVLHQNAVIVEGTVNGSEPVRLLLDTGWGPLALMDSAAKRLRLSGGQARSLAIGGATRKAVTFEVFPDASLQPLIGPYDGVLSTEFFRDLVLQIDYPRKVLRFFQRSPLPAGQGIPMVFVAGAGKLPFSDAVQVDGRPVRALFDTGGSGGFMAMPRLVDRAKLELLPEPTSGPRVGVGMLAEGKATQAAVRFASVQKIRVGTIERTAPRVLVAPVGIEGGAWGHDLIIGYGFFREYVVTFDYPGRRIHFT